MYNIYTKQGEEFKHLLNEDGTTKQFSNAFDAMSFAIDELAIDGGKYCFYLYNEENGRIELFEFDEEGELL